MKKVFCLCTESECRWFLVGKEYPVIDGKVLVEPGYLCYPFNSGDITDLATFQIIEREVFTANDQEWFKHVPGDPMPCDGGAMVYFLFSTSSMELDQSDIACSAGIIAWSTSNRIVGWRFAEEAKPESQESDLVIEVDDVITHREMLAMDAEPLKSTDNMGVSKPVVDEWIKRENEFTEKQQAKQEAEAQKEQAKAEQMAQAGEVFQPGVRQSE